MGWLRAGGLGRWLAAGALLLGALAAGLVLVSTLRTASAQADSRIALSPAAGPSGSLVGLSGRGFAPRRRLAVSVGLRTVRRIRTDRSGRFSLKFRVRFRVRGSRSVPVAVRGRGRRIVGNFQASSRRPAGGVAEIASSTGARLRWAPAAVAAGRSIVVSGRGFGRRRVLRLSGPGTDRRLRADRRGAFDVRLRTSRAFPGELEVVVRARRPRRPWSLGVRVLAPGALVGAYVNPDTADGQSRREVTGFEGLIGRGLGISHTYRRWASGFNLRASSEADEAWAAAGGRIPMISHGDGSYPAGRNLLDAINSGAEDNVIVRAARAFRRFGRPLLYRLLWEMNGEWNSYNVTHASTPGTQDGTAKFVRAWRRVHRIFRREGAANAAFVWCPNATNRPETASNHWRRYYPGDAYVDWVCADGYNREARRWETFAEIFDPIYADFPQKPFMIGETGSVESGDRKPRWIADAREHMKTRMPRTEAFLWFHRGYDPEDDSTDWRVDTSSAALDAFRGLVADPYFRP